MVPKAVVALAGARDHYQLPLALQEGGLLQTLVTEFYWPPRLPGPARLRSARSCAGLTAVTLSGQACGAALLMHLTRRATLNRSMDRALGQKARAVALRENAALFCYSYYASEAFKPSSDPLRYRFLFQLHPHPRVTRRILQDEIERVPTPSLVTELEMSLSDDAFDDLASEPHLANGWVVASSFTAQTLAEEGIPRQQIRVVPYGVENEQFTLRTRPPDLAGPFTVIFVGSMIQRKGLSYLLDAARLLKTQHLSVVLCGRGQIDQALLDRYADLKLEIHIGLPYDRLIPRMQASDLFALPSLVEGFGHVILETMSCGLPVLATPHTSAPDIIEEGRHGFIVPVRSAEAIAEKLAWGLDHRAELAEMGRAAAYQARQFTWARFREGIRTAYQSMVDAV